MFHNVWQDQRSTFLVDQPLFYNIYHNNNVHIFYNDAEIRINIVKI